MRICAIAGCTNSSYTLEKWRSEDCVQHGVKNGSKDCSCKPPFMLYTFPTEKRNPDGRREWIKVVNRKDVSTGKVWKPKYDDRICSLHFRNNEKSKDCPNPCINLGYTKDIKVRAAPKERAVVETKNKRRRLDKDSAISGTSSLFEDQPIGEWDHAGYGYQCSCSENCNCVGCVEKEAKNKSLEQDNLNLKLLLEEAKSDRKPTKIVNNCAKFLKSDKKAKIYTGLPNKRAFDDLYKMLESKAAKLRYWGGEVNSGGPRTRHFRRSPRKMGPQRKLQKKEEMLLVLIKLRLGLHSALLSDMFGVSVATVSSIFNTWIKFLSSELKPLIFWPDRDTIRTRIPPSLRYYKNLRCTIDCTEVFITRPRDREIQALTWSDYKRHNTVKFLIGIAPNGTISYLSKVWGGRASDRKITLSDGFMDLVEPYDVILADRGFTIKEDLMLKMATLEIPPPSSGLEQMSTQNVQKTKRIANARIHVERAIGRIKWFAILQNTLPISLVPLVDDIVTVCAALCNLLPPLV